jgi:pyruvate,water dikinase
VAGAHSDRDVVWLDEVGHADFTLVGAKLGRLGALRALGARVPDAFVLTTRAFDTFLGPARAELERVLEAPSTSLDDEERLGQAARAFIEQHPFPPLLYERLLQAHAELAVRTGLGSSLSTAVRSSGVFEDGAEASFAGQYDTYLGLRSAESVVDYVRKCWASCYTARAIDYRRRLGLPISSQGIAVGVMQLIDARSAGVTLTLNPITGNRHQAVVEANWGFGESVVSGLVTPDHFLVKRPEGDILEERIGVKRVWSVFDPEQGRVVEQPTPSAQASSPSLSHDEVRELVRLAVEIEVREGCPQDVEWAIDAHLPFPHNVFLLQHRPETSWVGRQGQETESGDEKRVEEEEDEGAYDPVAYALRKVFKVRVP